MGNLCGKKKNDDDNLTMSKVVPSSAPDALESPMTNETPADSTRRVSKIKDNVVDEVVPVTAFSTASVLQELAVMKDTHVGTPNRQFAELHLKRDLNALSPDNFDADGQPRASLSEPILSPRQQDMRDAMQRGLMRNDPTYESPMNSVYMTPKPVFMHSNLVDVDESSVPSSFLSRSPSKDMKMQSAAEVKKANAKVWNGQEHLMLDKTVFGDTSVSKKSQFEEDLQILNDNLADLDTTHDFGPTRNKRQRAEHDTYYPREEEEAWHRRRSDDGYHGVANEVDGEWSHSRRSSEQLDEPHYNQIMGEEMEFSRSDGRHVERYPSDRNEDGRLHSEYLDESQYLRIDANLPDANYENENSYRQGNGPMRVPPSQADGLLSPEKAPSYASKTIFKKKSPQKVLSRYTESDAQLMDAILEEHLASQ